MSDKIYKLVEVVGTSAESFAKAADAAVRKASKTIHNIEWFEVTEMRGRVDKDKVGQFQVKMKLGFRLDD